MRMPRFRFTVRRMMTLVAILALPLAIAAYRHSAGRKAALAEAKARLAQAEVARSVEDSFLKKAREAPGSVAASEHRKAAAGHRTQAEVNEQVAAEILDRYGIKSRGSK